MKSIKYLAAAALALLAVGCNKESVTEVPDGQMVDVTFTAALPGEIATKAIGDGMTAKNLYVSVYENDADKTKLPLDQTAKFTDLKTTVKFSLVKGKTYNFVFWAQAKEGAPYDITDLKNIKVSYDNAVANDETRDAFYATRKELKVNGALTETIKLYRPFAQVNFGTADYAEAVAAGLKPVRSVFTATSVASVFDTFEAEGKVEKDNVTFTEAALPGETLVTKDGDYTWMTMNYIIPAGKQGEKHISNVTAEFLSDAGESVKVSAPQAPVQNNYRTNILGNLLTSQVIFNIEIVPIFDEPDNDIDLVNIKNVESLKALFATGGEATLSDDLVVDEPISVAAGAEVTLDLNGKTVTNTEDLWDESKNAWSVISVRGGKLVLKGNGTVKAKEDDAFAVDVMDGGSVIIEDGTYVGNMHSVYVYEGSAEIRGGHYSIQQLSENPDPYGYVLNCYDANRKAGTTKIIVYGGEFEKFNPADCIAEGSHTNFLAEGYKTVQKGDNYVVVPANQTTVSTEAELDEAIATVEAGVKSEILIAAGTYKNVIDVRSDKVITFKPAVEGASVVLGGINGASNGTKTACVFEGITFDNSIQETGWFTGTAQKIFPCVGVWGGQYTFKNCKFIVDGNSGKETGVMTWWTLKDCKTALTFDGCTFEGKNNHAEARAMQIYGHVDLNVLNCKLSTAKRYALKYVANEGYTANIKNCEVSNCAYTVELGSADYPGSKYTVNFEGNTLAEGIADYKVAHEEGAVINGGKAK